MKTIQIRNAIFWALIVIFVLLAAVVLSRGRLGGIKLPSSTMIYLAAIFFALAAALVVLTVKIKESCIRKFFFILTGASAMGIPICIILHNVIYGLCIKFGWAFQEKGEDEPVFLILAIFVFPALYVLGSLGSIVTLISGRLRKKSQSA